MKPKRITFFGLFGQQNWGNDCTLEAILLNSRKHLPDFDFDCVCTGPEEISKIYGIHSIPLQGKHRTKRRSGEKGAFLKISRILFFFPKELLHWCKSYRALKGTRMLIVPGTGILTEFERKILGRCYEIFMWSMIAKLRHCNLLFVSVGAGPVLNPMSRWFIKLALSMADYRSYRNDYSKKYLERIGFKANMDPIYPDLAFSLPITMMENSINRNSDKLVIGVGVKDYYGKDAMQQDRDSIYKLYVDKTGYFIIWLYENGYTVRLLVGDTLYDNNVKEDIKYNILNKGVDYNNGNIIDEPIHSVGQIVTQISKTDVVVSPRFHNIILALMLNKPVISLSYHDKFSSLMADQELEEYCLNLDDLNIDRLIEMFTKLMDNAENIKHRIQLKAEENRLSLEKQYKLIFYNTMYG